MTQPGRRVLQQLQQHEALRKSVESEYPQRFSRFRPLGSGGMGVVLAAWDAGLQREVALKQLSAGAPSLLQRQRLEEEAKALAALRHPHVVAVHDLLRHEGQLLLVMDCVEGQSLAERLERGPLEVDEACRIAVAVAEGLQHAHEQGVIHRDVKPGNVLLARDGRVLLTDFGLAKRLGASVSLTKTGQLLGTPGYLAPEQLTDAKRVDQRSDVYGLGATLYEMLTGVPVCAGEGFKELLVQVLEVPAQDPRTLRPELPHALARVCLRCLEKEPARRYPTAAAVADALRAAQQPTAPRTWRRALSLILLAVGLGALAATALAPAQQPAPATAPAQRSAVDASPPHEETPQEIAERLGASVARYLQRGELAAAERELTRLGTDTLTALSAHARRDLTAPAPSFPGLRDAVERCAEAAAGQRPRWRLRLLHALGEEAEVSRLAISLVGSRLPDPELALEIVYVLGNLRGMNDPAVQAAIRQLEAHPDSPSYRLGQLLKPGSQVQELELLARSREASFAPGLADVLNARLERQHRGDDLAASVELAREAVLLRPLDPWVLWAQLRVQHAVGDSRDDYRACLPEVQASCWQARALNPLPVFWALPGENLLLIAEYAAAKRELTEAIRLSVYEPSLRRSAKRDLVVALVGLGELEEARRVAAQVRAEGPLEPGDLRTLEQYPGRAVVRAALNLLE